MQRLHDTSALGGIAACVYIACFGLPFERDISLISLAFFGLLAALSRVRTGSPLSSPLVLPILMFLLATGLSSLVSIDMDRSLRLSVALLPAVLLFFLIADYGDGLQDIRWLYLVFAAVGLGLSSALVWTAGQHSGMAPTVWVPNVGSPLLVVPNDGTLLSVIAPLSLALLYREPRGAVGILAALSLLFSVCAVCLLQSRVAILTMVASLTCAAVFFKPRLGLACGFTVVLLVILIDGFRGFPLVAKFAHLWDPRISLWLVAWSLFLEAPVLGHGPHTFSLLYKSRLQELNLPNWLPLDPHTNVPWVHNLYLEILAEQGMVGLVALGFLLVCGVSVAWRGQRTASSEVRVFTVGALAGLVGLCVAAAFELTLMRQWVAILLFTFLGVITRLSAPLTQTLGGERWNKSIAV